MKIVLQQCYISLSNNDVSKFCVACCICKAHRLHTQFSHMQVQHDIKSPPVISTQNNEYSLIQTLDVWYAPISYQMHMIQELTILHSVIVS